MMKKTRLIIQNSIECHIINPELILYISSDGNYCNIHLTDGTVMQNIPVQLGHVARLIRQQLTNVSAPQFLQIGRRHIVNSEHLLSIFPSQKLLLFDLNVFCTEEKISISPSSAALVALVSQINAIPSSFNNSLGEPLSYVEIGDDEVEVLNE